jgi:hypothetical protein
MQGPRKDSHVEAYLGNSIYSLLPLSMYVLSLIAQKSFLEISVINLEHELYRMRQCEIL